MLEILTQKYCVVSKKKWSGDVETKWNPPEDFFKQSAAKIASGLKSKSKNLKQAMSRLNFYINRAGKNLSASEKKKLDSAKNKLSSLYEAKAETEVIAVSTPWGASQGAQKIMPGLIWYSTAGHGGLYVSKALADKKLSLNARSEGIKYAGAYWYEEDVQWNIPFYENPEWLKLGVEKKIFSSEPSKEEMKSTIEKWIPDYFKAQKEAIVEFKALKPGDLIHFDRADSKPYTVKELMGSKAVVERDGSKYQVSKTMYFNRAVKVEQK